MHYYQKNIGDYRRDTMHLSPLEHGIYNLFLDTYYLTEKPLCADHAELMRTHCLRTAYEISAAENVLKDFFDLCENGYSHKRCDIEIESFHGKSNSARESAKARWERVRCERNANALNSHSEGNANHKPITNNHKPITNKKHSSEYSEVFELAWNKYPKREGSSKKDAFKAWSARIKSGVLPSVMIDGTERYAAYCKAQGTEQQYIKHPSTFFGVGEHYTAEWKPNTVAKCGIPKSDNFDQRNYGTEIKPL